MAQFASKVPPERVAEPDPRAGAILEIAASLGTTLDLGELLEGVMLKIARMLGAERASLFLVDRTRRDVWSRVPGGAGPVEVRLPLGHGLVGHVAQAGVTLNVKDAYADERFRPDIDRVTGYQTGAVLAVPIRGKDGTIIGVAQVVNKARGFSVEDEEMLSSVAPLIGLSVENATLYSAVRARNEALAAAKEQLHRKVGEVDLLLAIEKELSVAAEPNELLTAILRKAQGIFEAASVSLLLVEEGALELRSVEDPVEPVQVRVVAAARLGEYVSTALRSESPVEVASDDGTLQSMAGLVARRLLCVRLVAQGQHGPTRVLGAIEWTDPASGEFSDDDQALAVTVAAQVGRAVDVCRARVENERTSRLAILGRMMGGLVHDMRSPMTVIAGYSELLVAEGDPAVRERYSQQILAQIDLVNAMSRDVLAFIRGERQVLARRVPLAAFWQDMLPMLTRELEPNHVDLKLRLDYVGVARLDEGKFQRVVTNLARNAAQAMPSGGTFTVSCSAEGDTLHLRFADDGPGLPESVAARVFTAFNSHGKEGGTGLGLALVKEIVEGHGGHVSCTTMAGKGTTFDIRVPRAVVQ